MTNEEIERANARAGFRKFVRRKLHGMREDLKQISKDTSEILGILLKEEPKELPEPIDLESLDDALIAWDPVKAIATVPELKVPAGEFRDWLANKFNTIQRVNDQETAHGYSAPDDKHRDAFVKLAYVDSLADRVIDFCMGSSGPGVLREHLQWVIVQPPW